MLETLKKRQQFLDVKNHGQSWSTELFIIQGISQNNLIRHKKPSKKLLLFKNSEELPVIVDDNQPTVSFIDNAPLLECGSYPQNIEPALSKPFFGFTATKRLGNAVKRNRAKRRLRELCRLNYSIFNSQTAYIFIARDKILLCTSDELTKQLYWCIKHLHRLLNTQQV